MIRYVLTLLFLTFLPALALPLYSEVELNSALESGEIDRETFFTLAALADERPGLCLALSELRRVPEVTDEELAVLDSLCVLGAVDSADIPAGLFIKIGPFVSFPGHAHRSLAADYRLRQGYDTAGIAQQGGHSVALQWRAERFSAESRLVSDGFGRGRFRRNSVRVQGTGFLSELQLGNCAFRPGEGLTLGGAPLAAGSIPLLQTFSKSVFSPDSRDPFGVLARANVGPLFPFAFFFSDPDHNQTPGRNRTLGYGLCAEQGAGSCGVILLRSVLNGARGADVLTAFSKGIFALYRPSRIRAGAELSFSDSGFAFQGECIRRSGQVDAGMGFHHYSQAYFNPVGRGESAFSGRIQTMGDSADGLRFYGLRRNERGLNAFLRFKNRVHWIRPWLTADASGVWRESRLCAGVTEHVLLPGHPVSLEFAQKAGLFQSSGDTTFSAALSGAAETRLRSMALFSVYAEAGRPREGVRQLRGRLRTEFTFPARLRFAFGASGTCISDSAGTAGTFCLFAEQKISWQGGGLAANLTFSGPKSTFAPASLGLELNHDAF
ncbi:MAG: hypothetical protein V1913_01365 [Fibrobacterota bacterium]